MNAVLYPEDLKIRGLDKLTCNEFGGAPFFAPLKTIGPGMRQRAGAN